jgi:predicted PurR-regulated permease PerM
MEPAGLSHRRFAERVLIVLAILGVALLLWALRGLVILIFGAVLVAVILRVIATPLKQRLRLPDGVALLIAVLILGGIVGIAFWLFGAEVARQASTLRETIPAAWQVVQARLEAFGLAEPVREWVASLRGGTSGVLSNLSSIVVSVGNAVTDTLLVVVGGIFFAVEPRLYRTGIVKLVPESARPNVDQALEDCWRALRLWLLGRLTSMLIVGLLTGIGLWLIGIPAALTLGIAAGLLDFVPFVGPILASIPALLLALASDPALAIWVVVLYLVIQQIEGNIVTPLVQRRAVELPPALLLFSLVAAGLVFGIAGVLFAEPLTVVLYVLVKRLYVREALHTDTNIPGERQG